MKKYFIIALALFSVAFATWLIVLNTLPADTSNAIIARDSAASNQSEGLNTQPEYVGSATCSGCHALEVEQWQKSDHFKSMQLANEASVLGDFDNVVLEFHGIETRLSKQGDHYSVTTLADGNQPETFKVQHTFGHFPLQQYLIATKDGHVQALNVAWDSRLQEEGGQRWFHLQPDEKITQEHPFYWTKHFQNWNSRCADCHSTNLQRNYSSVENRFSTTYAEVNVACEACHGPASIHLKMANSDALKQANNFGFENVSRDGLSWQFKAGRDIAVASGTKNQDEINMCARCHSLRSPLIGNQEAHQLAPEPSNDFHDLNRLQLLNTGTYFADGQSKEEAFVVGSFVQSKMHHKGVSCGNCHNPHSGKTIAADNSLCAQCHQPDVFDSPAHHKHQQSSEGAQCVSCHMPERPFMQVDFRRDHSFTIPRPEMSIKLGVPNACTGCHTDQDDKWAAQQTKDWGVAASDEHWAYLIDRASRNDVLVTRAAVAQVLNTGLPAAVRASLLSHLAPMPSRVSADAARQSLADKSPLVRRAAVTALSNQAFELRWQLLKDHFDDPNRSVRVEIGQVLVRDYRQMSGPQRAQLAGLVVQVRQSFQVSLDSVSTQLNLANLEIQLGNFDATERAFKQALIIEPSYVPAMLSLAEFYRSTGGLDQEKPLLLRAVEVAPDSGAAQHSLGLYYVRQQNYAEAMSHLALAVQQRDASPYYAYVYAVALEHQGEIGAALEQLRVADIRWPNQYELLFTLILYLEKSQNQDQVLPYLSKLSAIAPSAPPVKQLVEKYQSLSK